MDLFLVCNSWRTISLLQTIYSEVSMASAINYDFCIVLEEVLLVRLLIKSSKNPHA